MSSPSVPFLFFYCRFASARALPSVDQIDDILTSDVLFVDGTTTVSFTRKLDTGDIAGDLSLSARCVYLLWACCGMLVGSDISYHGSSNRGVLGMVCFPSATECAGIQKTYFSNCNVISSSCLCYTCIIKVS